MRLAAIAVVVVLFACGETQTTAQPTPVAQRPGPLGDTWSWDGSSWHRAASGGPSPRYLASLAYDAARRVFVLFGGQTAKGSSDETWTWNGTTWLQLNPAHRPPPRRAAAMAYDPKRHVIVLYGGRVPDQAEGHPEGDTWVWDANDWTEVDHGPGPPGVREGPSLVTANDRIILFGGRASFAVYYGDAWSWDGKTWLRLDSGPGPAGRSDSAATWDPVHGSLLVFGGYGLNATAGPRALGTPLTDTWSLMGPRWTQLSSSGPGQVSLANAMWDEAGKRVLLLLGIQCPRPSSAAWAWDGKAWLRLDDPGISARWGSALAQDPSGKAVLFGGSDEAGC